MKLSKIATLATSLSLISVSALASIDVEKNLDVSRVSASYEQPFYILTGAAKNNSNTSLQNVRVSFDVYQNGKVVDTVTTTMKNVEPGETVRWQTRSTKQFNKYVVAKAIAD